jgi:hypothetical protein
MRAKDTLIFTDPTIDATYTFRYDIETGDDNPNYGFTLWIDDDERALQYKVDFTVEEAAELMQWLDEALDD